MANAAPLGRGQEGGRRPGQEDTWRQDRQEIGGQKKQEEPSEEEVQVQLEKIALLAIQVKVYKEKRVKKNKAQKRFQVEAKKREEL